MIMIPYSIVSSKQNSFHQAIFSRQRLSRDLMPGGAFLVLEKLLLMELTGKLGIEVVLMCFMIDGSLVKALVR